MQCVRKHLAKVEPLPPAFFWRIKAARIHTNILIFDVIPFSYLFFFVAGKKASITSLKDVVTVQEGKKLRLVCKVDGQPPPKVTWFKNGRSINKSKTKYNFLHTR